MTCYLSFGPHEHLRPRRRSNPGIYPYSIDVKRLRREGRHCGRYWKGQAARGDCPLSTQESLPIFCCGISATQPPFSLGHPNLSASPRMDPILMVANNCGPPARTW